MATYTTAGQIVSRLIRLSGQVPGTGVQIYSQDIFLDMINTTVRMVGRKAWWPHFMDWMSVELDGTTGVPTADLVGVLDHTDIKAIYPAGCEHPLNYISDKRNPSRYSGNRIMAYEALPISHPQFNTRIIRAIPATSTDKLTLRVRIAPKTLGSNDLVPLDEDLIVFGVLWSFFEDEGDNPQQAGKYRAMFDAKFTELVSSLATHRVPIDGHDDSGFGDRDGTWSTGSANSTDNQNLTGEY